MKKKKKKKKPLVKSPFLEKFLPMKDPVGGRDPNFQVLKKRGSGGEQETHNPEKKTETDKMRKKEKFARFGGMNTREQSPQVTPPRCSKMLPVDSQQFRTTAEDSPLLRDPDCSFFSFSFVFSFFSFFLLWLVLERSSSHPPPVVKARVGFNCSLPPP